MKHLITLSSLIIAIVVKVLLPAIGLTTTPNNAGESTTHRAQLESQMLAETVRVYFETWVMADGESGYEVYDSVGHATVRDGRYLVTHNHTEIPLSIRHRDGDPESFTRVSLFDAAGELRHEGPLSDFSIVVEDTETLVFGHKEEGFLESLGFSSASFRSWEQLPLEAGMEVAQIDWDGERARVDWVSVNSVAIENGVPRITLDNGALVGASGGGIFYGGQHIANNWRVEEKIDSMGNVISQTTTAALNSQLVTNAGVDA